MIVKIIIVGAIALTLGKALIDFAPHVTSFSL